jgi:polar amino acid transport system substrate-binding protein
MKRIALAALVVCALATPALAAPDYGNCQVTGTRGSVKLKTVVPGALSVRPDIPAPGWWNGDSPDTIKDGFEYCMAANMAYRAGLDRVIVVNRSFAQLLTGQAQGFDIALSQITITPERQKVVDFTHPYYSSDQGVLVRAGTKVDKVSIRKLRIAVEQGTTTYYYVTERIKPTQSPRVFPQTAPMFAALAAGQVDAVIYDTPTVLAEARQSHGAFVVAGRYDMGERWGGLVNKGSPNLATFNKLIDDFHKDGTLERLTKTYLMPGLGIDPAKLTVFTPPISQP